MTMEQTLLILTLITVLLAMLQHQRTLKQLQAEATVNRNIVATYEQLIEHAEGRIKALEALPQSSIKVTKRGVQFGLAWFTHSQITQLEAKALNEKITDPNVVHYMKWVAKMRKYEAPAHIEIAPNTETVE